MSKEQTAEKSAAAVQPGAVPAPDERDAAIERLERALAEERQKSAALRNQIDGLAFKAEVLEKSYAKQLADARERTAAVARELAERQAELDALAKSHEESQRLLADARQALERQSAAGAKARMPAPGSGGDRRGSFGEASLEGTINALLGATPWKQERTPARSVSPSAEPAAPEPGTPTGEMLPPELVFTGDGDEDDDERK